MATTTAGITDTIPSITADTTLNNFADNTWGYCISAISASSCSASNVFMSIKNNTNADTIVENPDLSASGNTASDTLFLTFGAKINLDITPATYSNTQIISLVAEDLPSDLYAIDYMQDMTPEICANTRTPSSTETTTVETKQLIDKRDNKKYWVAKLADGHCWMTQNLALDLSTSTTLTPDDTDISANWTPSISTTTTLRTGNTSYTDPQSFKVGDYVINTPNAGTNLCPSWSANITSCSGIASLTNVGSGTGYTDDFISTGTDTNIVAVDTANKKYDAHYLIGNYYTWNAATAGTGGTITNTNAASSICPKGWHLPTSNSTADGSFGYLMSAYSLPSTNSSATAAQINKLGSAPLYFYRTGRVYPDSSDGLHDVGFNGYYWSSTAYSSTSYAYNLYFNSGYLYPSNYYSRSNGFSVRCLL